MHVDAYMYVTRFAKTLHLHISNFTTLVNHDFKRYCFEIFVCYKPKLG